MSSTVFTDFVTIITADWLNSVNAFVYGAIVVNQATKSGSIAGDWNVGGNLNVTGNVTAPNGVGGTSALPHVVTGSRVLGTTYTNTTTKAMFLMFNGLSTGGTSGSATFTATVAGVVAGVCVSASGFSNGTMSILVPVGATYVINAVTAGGAAASIVFWGETY